MKTSKLITVAAVSLLAAIGAQRAQAHAVSHGQQLPL
jgi:hypothetical protein